MKELSPPTLQQYIWLRTTCAQILQTSKDYVAKGKSHIWIYLVDDTIICHSSEHQTLTKYLCGDHDCQLILDRKADDFWHKLGIQSEAIRKSGGK